jgi:translocation protein SEC63
MPSTFQDNFKRDAEEDMLEYDDSAFYYFSMALLTCMTLPVTYYTLYAIAFGNVKLDTKAKNAKTTAF